MHNSYARRSRAPRKRRALRNARTFVPPVSGGTGAGGEKGVGTAERGRGRDGEKRKKNHALSAEEFASAESSVAYEIAEFSIGGDVRAGRTTRSATTRPATAIAPVIAIAVVAARSRIVRRKMEANGTVRGGVKIRGEIFPEISPISRHPESLSCVRARARARA